MLLPLVFKSKELIKKVPKRYLIGMFVGCGLPYLLVAGTGMRLAPVSDGSALIPRDAALVRLWYCNTAFQATFEFTSPIGISARHQWDSGLSLPRVWPV